MIYETICTPLRPKTLSLMEPVIRELAEGCWEDDAVQMELMNFANDIRSRLQRIERGDLQK